MQELETLCYNGGYIVRQSLAIRNHNFIVYGQSGKSENSRIESSIVRRCVVLHVGKKSSILLDRTGIRTISSVACGFSPIKLHFSDYLKSLISRIMKFMYF